MEADKVMQGVYIITKCIAMKFGGYLFEGLSIFLI